MEDSFDKIFAHLKNGKAVLFIGAGASIPSGGPSGQELLSELKEKFGGNKDENDFFNYCQDLIDTPGNNLSDIEDFIRRRLEKLQPSKWHKLLAKQNWKAIFTTNYDTVLEQAYQSTEAIRRYTVVAKPSASKPTEPDRIGIFKLMGTLVEGDEDSEMILTRSQYSDNLVNRQQIFDLLFDMVQNGTVIFLGYSGKDRIAFDVIDRILKKKDVKRLAWSYFVTPTELSEQEKIRLAARRMLHVQMSFEDFMAKLEGFDSGTKITPTLTGTPVKIKSKPLIIDHDLFSDSQRYFELLNETSSDGKYKIDDFFRAVITDWTPYAKGWDFKREIYDNADFKQSKYSDTILRRVRNEMIATDPSANKSLFLLGPAGSGKTVVARRLAYQLYLEGFPVIWVDPTKESFETKYLIEFLSRLSDLYHDEKEESFPKVLLIIDDYLSTNIDPLRLSATLASVRKPCILLCTERSGADTNTSSYLQNDVFELSQNLTSEEKPKFIKYLASLGYIDKDLTWEAFSDKGIEDSFFAALYTLIDPSKKPLEEIIKDQYRKLPDEIKKLYSYVAAFHRFNLQINLELLVRALGKSYEDFFSLANSPEAQGVIFDIESEQKQQFYVTHHPIMAEKTIDFFFPFDYQQKDLYKEILSDINFSIDAEREMVEKLFSFHLSSTSDSTTLPKSMKQELFRLVCDQYETRSLLHHWGILEDDIGNFLEAEDLLKRALQTKPERIRGESDQNILNSLGALYANLGIARFKSKHYEGAEKLFQEAERYFLKARYGLFPNAYSFHSHARMYIRRAELDQPIEDSMSCLAEAMHIIEKAEDAIHPASQKEIQALKTWAYALMGNESRVKEQIEILSRKYRSGKGYSLYANYLFRNRQDAQNLVKANDVVDEGLERFSKDPYLLTTKLRIVMEITGSRPDLHYGLLKRWFESGAEHTPLFLFYLGVAAYIHGDYDDSEKYFIKLDEISSGFHNRAKLQYTIIDDAIGGKRRFRGKISQVRNASYGELVCSDLGKLNRAIRFRPFSCKFMAHVDQEVTFNITFQTNGPWATDVIKA